MDTENPVVQLCVQGMQAEGEGRAADARELFQRAWDASTDDYEACIAAHYLARHQTTPEDTRHWNQLALDRAQASGDERARPFYASLHLNLGRCAEELGARAEAHASYQRAAEALHSVAEGPYREMIERGILAALERTSG
ncbi:MAG: hypothetical protein JXB05_21795 [Myxococcaceae bacterium]|nr:hypothetical protein [Myxococcaceae bacterium]